MLIPEGGNFILDGYDIDEKAYKIVHDKCPGFGYKLSIRMSGYDLISMIRCSEITSSTAMYNITLQIKGGQVDSLMINSNLIHKSHFKILNLQSIVRQAIFNNEIDFEYFIGRSRISSGTRKRSTSKSRSTSRSTSRSSSQERKRSTNKSKNTKKKM